ERLSRSWSIARQAEFSLVPRLNIDQNVVVFQLRRLALPIEVRRIVVWHLEARAARKDRVLFRPTATKDKIFHAIDIIELSRVDVSVEDDYLQVPGIGRNRFVRVIRFWDGTEARAAEDRIMKDNKRLLYSFGFGVVQPFPQLYHLLRVFWPIPVPQRWRTVVVLHAPKKNKSYIFEVELVDQPFRRYAEIFQIGHRIKCTL